MAMIVVRFNKWLDDPKDRWLVRLGGVLFKYHVTCSVFMADSSCITVDSGIDGTYIYDGAQTEQGEFHLWLHVGSRNRKPYPIEPLTCVTITKRILGISNWRIQTPMQLKRYIESFPCVEGVYQIG